MESSFYKTVDIGGSKLKENIDDRLKINCRSSQCERNNLISLRREIRFYSLRIYFYVGNSNLSTREFWAIFCRA